MSITIKSGSLSEFFASARETAKEIDEARAITPKNIIWVEPNDLRALLKPERTNLVKFLRQNHRITFSDLMQAMERTSSSLNNDLALLSKYDLVKISKESNPGHGIRKVVESTFDDNQIQVIAQF